MPKDPDLAKFGRIGANESWARTWDRTGRTAPARRALDKKFEDQVDPNRELPPEERAKRATNARKAHFQRMALKSAEVRRRKAQTMNNKANLDEGRDLSAPSDEPTQEWVDSPFSAAEVLVAPFRVINYTTQTVFRSKGDPISPRDARALGVLEDVTHALYKGEPIPLAEALRLGVITEMDIKQ